MRAQRLRCFAQADAGSEERNAERSVGIADFGCPVPAGSTVAGRAPKAASGHHISRSHQGLIGQGIDLPPMYPNVMRDRSTILSLRGWTSAVQQHRQPRLPKPGNKSFETRAVD